jgi:lipopolysaccharide export system permease protein
MLTGTVLYNNANVLLLNQVPVADVVKMVLLFLPFLVNMTMPVAMAVGASLAVSRLGRDSEVTVLRASGVSLVRIFAPIFLVGLLVSVADFYFGEYVVPPAVGAFEELIGEMATHSPHLSPQAGQWIVATDQTYALYVQSIIPRKGYMELLGVAVVAGPRAILNGESAPMVATAKHGTFKDGHWTLENANQVRYSFDHPGWTLAHAGTFTYNFAVDPQVFKQGFLLQIPMYSLAHVATHTLKEMGTEIRKNNEQHITDIGTILDYHFKLSIPFSCLVMAICCPPLALRFAKGGGFMGTLLSICLVFVYWNTMLLTRILGSPGPEGSAPLLAPAIAAWSQNVIFTVLGLWVLWKSE